VKKWALLLKEKKFSVSVITELKANCDLRDLELEEEEIEDEKLMSTRFVKPPVLYRLPALKTLKNLIYKYLDLKKKL